MTLSDALANLRSFAFEAARLSDAPAPVLASVEGEGSLAERVARFLLVANSDEGPEPFAFSCGGDGGWGSFFSAVGVVSGLTPDGEDPASAGDEPPFAPLVFLDGSALASTSEEADGTMVVLRGPASTLAERAILAREMGSEEDFFDRVGCFSAPGFEENDERALPTLFEDGSVLADLGEMCGREGAWLTLSAWFLGEEATFAEATDDRGTSLLSRKDSK